MLLVRIHYILIDEFSQDSARNKFVPSNELAKPQNQDNCNSLNKSDIETQASSV